MRLGMSLASLALALAAASCDPGYSVAKWAGAPVDKETYHEAYGWGEAADASTSEVLGEIRKPCREERLPYFVREYLRRTREPGVIGELPRLVLDARHEYVQASFAEALESADRNVPRERLAEWRAALEKIVPSSKLRPLYKPAFAAALNRAQDEPGHFRSLAEEAARETEKERRKAAEQVTKEEKKAAEQRRKELERAEKERRELEKRRREAE